MLSYMLGVQCCDRAAVFDGGRTPPEACFAEYLVERRVKANLILIFSTNTNFSSFEF